MAQAPIPLKGTLTLITYILNTPEASIVFKSLTDAQTKDTISVTKEIDCLNYLLNKTETSKALVYINDLSKDDSLTTVYQSNFKMKSFIGLPIMGLSKKLIGVFYATFNTPKTIAKDQIKALNAVLDQASKLLLKNDEIKKQKYKNEELKSESVFQKEILTSTKVGTWVLNTQKNTLKINNRWAEIVGYTRNELRPATYETWRDLVHPEDLPSIEQKIKEHLFKNKQHYNVNFRMLHKKGHYVWINSTGFVIKWTEDHQPLIFTGSHFDITHEKQSDEAIKKNKWHLDEVQRIAKIGSWSFDVATQKHTYSPGFKALFGIEFENSYSKAFDYVIEEDKAKVAKAKKECLEQSTPYEIRYRITNQSGEECVIEENAMTIEDHNGTVISAYGTMIDITQRLKREQHLKLLESVITYTKDSVLITEAEPFDMPGPKILYVNDAFTKMTGYAAEDVIGKTPRLLQGPKTNKAELKKLSEALRKWEPYEMTTINYKKNGDEFWINFSITPVANEKGWYTHWIAIERDVTEEVNYKINQKLLLDISHFFTEKKRIKDSVQLTLNALIKRLDYCYGELWVTSSADQKLSLIASESTGPDGKTFKESNGGTDYRLNRGLPGVVMTQNKLIIWEDIQNHEQFERREHAKKSNLNTAISFPLIANNETLGVILFVTKDKLKKSLIPTALFEELQHMIGKEIKRKTLETEFNEAFDFTPGMLTINNEKGFFTKVNPAASKMLGYTEEELLSQPFWNFVHPDDKTSTEDITAVLDSGKPIYNFENRYITKSGKPIWLKWAATPRFRNGLIYGVAQDVTEFKDNEAKLKKLNKDLKRYTKKLETSNSELEQFAHVASHDLQEPLRMVTSFLGQLERKYKNDLDEKAQSYIHYAVDGANRMRSTILDILEYSRIDSEDRTPEYVDLNLKIKSVLGYYSNEIKHKKVTISYSNLPTILIPKSAAFKVFNNLFSNAFKYASEERQTQIEISATDKTSHWEFSIKDNGIGIAKEHFEKIFIIFQRLHGKGEYAGSGIGLSIVKKIIEHNNGKIWVESEINKGSTFYFQLPK